MLKETTGRDELYLFVNVTRRCSMNCRICFLSERIRKNDIFLNLSLLAKMLEHPLFSNAGAALTIMWEGGEPTLAGESGLQDYIEVAKRTVPDAQQSIVTNLLSCPDWLIDMTHREFSSVIESTFSYGGRETWTGELDKYLSLYSDSLRKIHSNNIECHVQFDVNRETFEAGTEKVMNYMLDNGVKFIDFNIAVEFADFYADPKFNRYGYPIFNSLSISYLQFSEFILEIAGKYKEVIDSGNLIISNLDLVSPLNVSRAFNVKQDFDFFTLNPDGTVTSNPLFSSIPDTFYGDISANDVDDVVNSDKRMKRSVYEHRRTLECGDCNFYSKCNGMSSFVPLFDGSGECSGFKRVFESLFSGS